MLHGYFLFHSYTLLFYKYYTTPAINTFFKKKYPLITVRVLPISKPHKQ